MFADFVAEFTPSPGAFVGICQVRVKHWQLYVDDASNATGPRVGIVMVSPEGLRMENSLRLGFRALNNEAEYEALITGLRVVQKLSAEEVEVFFELRLVVSQIEGSFEAKDYCISQYLKLFRSLQSSSQKVSVVRVPKSQNSHVD